MKKLPKELELNGYKYSRITKGRRYCLYEQNGIANMRCFELFKIRVSREKKINGTIIEKKELFPRNEDFGYTAWTICDLDEALAKFNELENE